MLLGTYTMRTLIKQGILRIAAHNSFRCCYHKKEKNKRLPDNASFSQPWKGKFCPFLRCLNCIILQHNLTDVTLFQKVLRVTTKNALCLNRLTCKFCHEKRLIIGLSPYLVICRSPDGRLVTLVCVTRQQWWMTRGTTHVKGNPATRDIFPINLKGNTNWYFAASLVVSLHQIIMGS